MIAILRKLRRLLIRLFYVWRRFILSLRGLIYGGQVSLSRNITISHPVIFQGKGNLIIENGVQLGFSQAGSMRQPILLQPRTKKAEIIIGPNSAIMNGCEIIALTSIRIGKNTLIGPSTWIVDGDFHGLAPDLRHTLGKTLPVVIGENVWIGARVIILKGVTIGPDAVVAAGCVVTRDISPGDIVAGNPSHVIGSVYNDRVVNE